MREQVALCSSNVIAPIRPSPDPTIKKEHHMPTPHKRLLKAGGLLAVAAVALTGCATSSGTASPSASAKPISGSVLFYDTSGGTVWTALDQTLFQNFTAKTGVTVTDDYNQDATKFTAAAEAGSVPWSLLFLPGLSDEATAAKAGQLVPIDTSIVPVNKLVKGSYDKYGIQVGTFGMVLAYNTKTWPSTGAHPSSMSDLFNTTKFPGKRCFFNEPEDSWVLEAALLASGTKPANLYPLDTKKAFAKLDTIKNDITWWSSGAASMQDFENGSCAMGIVWANRAYTAATGDKFPITVSWNGAGYANSVWSIPKGAPNVAAAQQLLKDVINDAKGQEAFASQIPTPIPAQVASASITAYPKAVQAFVPVGSNLRTAIAMDGDYYEKNNTALTAEFTQWMAQ
jgi:putative spermidine/putrescine transport system substrate-binding protein